MHMVLFQKKRTYSITSRERPDEKGLFLKRVGSLLEGGYSLKEVLDFLLKFEKGVTRDWIFSIQNGLQTGRSFHKELETLGFSDKVCSQIYIASQYGNYGKTITHCGEHLLTTLAKKKKLKSLASYPLFLLVFLIGMLLLMRFMILPHMEVLFSSVGTKENLLSNRIVHLVYYSPHILIGLLVFTLMFILVLSRLFRNVQMIKRIEILTRVPILKHYLKDYLSQFFFFEWGNLLLNGCSILEVIELMKGEDASKILRETGGFLSVEMKQGRSVYEALSRLPYFYEEGLQVVSHGENLGRLGTEMLVYAGHCEIQLNLRVEKFMERLQPVVFVFIGLMILIIYAALMLPVFSLMEGF